MRVRLGKVCLTPRGSYSAGATYSRLDLVSYEASAYVSLADSNVGHAVTDTSYWMKLMNGGFLLTYIQSHGLQTSSLSVAGNVLVGGGITVNEDVSVGGNLSVDDDLTVGGDINNQALEDTIAYINERIDALEASIDQGGGSSPSAEIADDLTPRVWTIIDNKDNAAVARAVAQMQDIFVTKTSFHTVFDLRNSSNQTINIGDSNLSQNLHTIVANKDFASVGGVSALGIGSGGGGGGGGTQLNQPLQSINTSGLSAPGASQDGKTIVWDNSTQKWAYGDAGGGGGISSVTITNSTPQTLPLFINSGATATGNSFSLSLNSSKYIPSTDDRAAWNEGLNDIEALQGLFTNGSAISAVTASRAERLTGSTTYTAWGQTYWTVDGVPQSISGDMSGVADIYMGNNKSVYMKDNPTGGASAQDVNLLTLNGSNNLSLGYGVRLTSTSSTRRTTYIEGGQVKFNVGYGNNSPIEAFSVEPNGQCYVRSSEGLRIGDALLQWSDSDKALSVTYCGQTSGAAANFYADGGVSALGLGSTGGGGGTGTVTRVIIASADTEKLTINNGAQVTITGSGTATIALTSALTNKIDAAWNTNNHPTTLSGYGITDANINTSTNKITLGSNNITVLTSNDITGKANKSEMSVVAGTGTNAGKTTITLKNGTSATVLTAHQAVVNNNPTLSWGTTSTVGTVGGTALKVTMPAAPTSVDSATRASQLTTTRKLWGQNFNGTGDVTGSLINVGSITMDGNLVMDSSSNGYIVMNNDKGIQIKNSNGTAKGVFSLNSHDVLSVGYGVRDAGYVTNIYGGDDINFILGNTTKFRVNSNYCYVSTNNGLDINGGTIQYGSSRFSFGSTYIDGFHAIELNKRGTLSGYGGFIDFFFKASDGEVANSFTSRIIEDANGRIFLNAPNGIRIGNGWITWDSNNNALKVMKYDGTAANFYTMGGVSALGFQSGGINSTDAFTINTLTTSSIANGSGNVKMGNICSNTPASGTPNWKILTTGAATFKGVTATSVSATGVTVSGANGTVSAAYVQGTYFSFGDDSYIYKDPFTHKLMYHDENGNSHEVSFVS